MTVQFPAMEPAPQLDTLREHLTTIRRNMEQIISENRQLRDTLQKTMRQLTASRNQNEALNQQQQAQQAQHTQVSQCVEDALQQVEELLLKTEETAEEVPE